ncbi:MAG: MerR family transcriptional regulator [Oscillospiraceae bacterium]|nr:MerR family transcriptional regulator [Oscillospiraceae bacterium]
MKLKTIRQVSLDYGISRQMLYYYEEMGLIKSSRKNDYAYRVYDESAVKRLQQIIILRKLQIPMKKINIILNNPEAATVIDIFKENIAEMEREISALSTIKFILEKFVSEIERITDVKLKLDLLNEDSVQKMAESLSLVQKNIKENFMSMNELNQAAETLEKAKEKSVKIVYRPPATVVEIKGDFGDIPHGDGKRRKIVEDMAKKFIEETNLFKIKPDVRVLILADWCEWNYYKDRSIDQDIVWITIPDDMEVPPPFTKRQYSGGLYAASTDPDFDLWKWAWDSGNFEWDNIGRAIGWEYFNPFNIHGLDDYDYENDWACSYTTELLPVREVKKFSEDEKKRINSELDAIIPCGEPIEIDLASMILQKNDDKGGIYKLNYPNGHIKVFFNASEEGGMMVSPQEFHAPIKIELRVKIDTIFDTIFRANETPIFFGCEKIKVGLSVKEELSILYTANGGWEFNWYKKCGAIPADADEFIDIELFLGRECAAIRLNGDPRYYGTDYDYIEALKENREYNLGSVWIGMKNGATVTVQSLRVTQL